MSRRREPEIATIADTTHDGRGIADVPGKKVFVSGALLGEEVRFVRRKKRRNFDEAELLEVLRPAADRVAPKCAAFGVCGGCSLQHMSAAAQREMKWQTLKDNLERIGGVQPERWLDPVYDDSADGGWHYRRRARLAVKDVQRKGRVLVGFRERHAPYVADMQRCEVLCKPVDDLLVPLGEMIERLSIRARLPQIEVAVGDNVTELTLRVLDPPTEDDRQQLAAFSEAHGVQISLQPAGPDSIEPLSDHADALHYRLPDFDVTLEFASTDFVQVNRQVNERLVAGAIELLEVEPSHRVLDLFCGIGNFSLPLARRAKVVFGVEWAPAQVERARHNALLNQLDNCTFACADLDALTGQEAWLDSGWDRVLLDPARSGAAGLMPFVQRLDAPRLVYVSCHPGTLARDSAALVGAGYRLAAAGIVDMFPHTAHVESIAVFEKTNKK